MGARRLGIQLANFLPGSTQLPGAIRELLLLTVDDHRVTTNARFFMHEGVLVSLAASVGIDVQGFPVSIPLLSSGLRFRLALRKKSDGSTPTEFVLDIWLDRFQVALPGVVAAKRIEADITSAKPTHLEPDPAYAARGPNEKAKPVQLVGGGVLRIEKNDGANAEVRLVDLPDPFDPEAPTGPIASIACEPPHMLLGASGFGLTLGKFTLDLSEVISPQEVLARNQGETWKGLYAKEAALYLPPDTPVVGPLSLTVRDALFGIPTGMQFEAQLEWGSMSGNDARQRCGLVLQQGTTTLDTSKSDVQLQSGAGPSYEVITKFTKPPSANGESPVVGVRVNDRVLEFAKGPGTTASTTLQVLDGSQLRVAALIGANDGDKPSSAELPEVVWTFRAPTGASASLQAALLKVQRKSGGTPIDTTSVRGTAADLADLVFSLPGETDPPVWQIGADFQAQTTTKTTLDLSTLKLPLGTQMLEAKGKSFVGRVRIEVVERSLLFVGTPTGVVSLPNPATTTPPVQPPIRRALMTYALPAFLREGQLTPVGEAKANVSPLSVPKNTLAEVEVDLEGLSTGQTAPAQPTTPVTPVRKVVRRASVGFAFGSETIKGWVWKDDDGTLTDASQLEGGTFDKQLQAWLNAEPVPDEIYIVSRTDDVAWNKTLDENTKYNAKLAGDRVKAIESRIRSLSSAKVHARSEFVKPDTLTPAPPADVDGSFESPDDGVWRKLVTQRGGWADPLKTPVWASGLKQAADSATYLATIPTDETRMAYRRADIWLVCENPKDSPTTEPSTTTEPSESSAKFLIPGPLSTDLASTTPKPITSEPTARKESLVRLRGVWDSPVVNGFGDVLPTMVEVTTKWKPSQPVQLPVKKPDGQDEQPVPIGLGSKAWQVQVRIAHDARADSTKVSLTVDIPDDEVTLNKAWVAVTLALAPAIVARLDAKEGLVAMPLLLGAGYLFEQFGWVKSGRAMLHRVATDYTDRGGRAVRFACDYSVGLDEINISLFFGVSIIGKGLVIRYTGVHVEIDWDKGAGNGLHLGYDQASVSVAKAGTWSLTGPAGELLRVTGARSGVGSTWVELDLAFAMNLGVIKVEGATIRITMNGSDFSAELRGLALTVKVPKLLEGKGALKVETGGTIRGALDIKVIPAKLSAAGAVTIKTSDTVTFVSVEVGVKFATALPLASTGLGIFGFMGRFVANGTRNFPTNEDDPVERELKWFQLPAEQKYAAKAGQYALGLGVVVGTLPDGGTTFNAEGSLTLGFPDISLVLGIIAHFIVPPKDVVEEGDDSQSGSAKLVGLISVDEKALLLGIRGAYNIPKVIDVQIPISGMFPFPGENGRPPAYLRIGADGQEGRFGQPVTVTLFPDLFKVKAWAYLMIEERGLNRLGGRDSLNFNGFSIGFGAGFDLRWGAGPLSLEASASILLGIGTKPLAIAGLVEVRGRLRLLFLTIGLEGRITVFLSEPTSWFEAEFCAEISLFLFSIRACISFASGKSELEPPPPEPCPLLGVVLTDARGGIVATAPDKLDQAPIVWPDVVPVVRFAAKFADGRKDGTFRTTNLDENPENNSTFWVGPEALQYMYRVDRIDLVRIDGTSPETLTEALPSMWWEPSYRPGVVVDKATQEEAKEEAKQLGLLYWHPNPAWRSILTAEDLPEPLPGGPLEGLFHPPKPVVGPKDPLEVFIHQTFTAICGYSPEPKPAFARGEDVGFSLFGRVNLKPRAPSPAPFSSYFELTGGRVLAGDTQTSTAALMALGATMDPAKTVGLANAVVLPGCTDPLGRGLMIDHVQFQGMDACTAAFALQSKPTLESPDLWLAMLNESESLDKHPALHEGFPLGRLRIAHFGCAKLGRRERVTRGGAVIRPLKHSTLEVVNSRAWGRLAHIEHVRGTEIDPDMRVLGMNERYSCGVNVMFAMSVRHVVVDLIVELVDVASVDVRIFSLQADGQPLAAQDVTLTNGGRHRIAVLAQDMRGLVIFFGQGGDWFLRGIEMRVPPWLPTQAQLNRVFDTPKHDASTKWPVVEGRRHIFAPWEAWTVEPETQGNVQLLRAHPQNAGPWFDVRVLPWARGRLAIVGVSAISTDARDKQREDQKKRDALKDSLKEAPKTPEDAAKKRFLLEPKAVYKLEITWSWCAKRSNGSTTKWTMSPPLPYYFRTAEAKPLPEPPIIPGAPKQHFLAAPIQGGMGYSQETFDPRGLQRYVLGIDPNPKAPPHFRHDPLSIHFAVDYVEQLAGRYGYVLLREVRRTRATAGELHPKKNPSPLNKLLDKPIKGPLPSYLMPAADKWIRNAIDASPCLGKDTKPALGGHTEQHFVDLIPGGEYDFVLCAQRTISNQVAEEVLILRTRFQASRYEGPEHLLAELGFDADGQGGRWYDAVVSTKPTLPTSGLVDDAKALEQARGLLGVSASAASRLPRTTLLWTGSGTNYSLVGALLEADEPILRPGRIEEISLQAKNSTITMSAKTGWCDTIGSVILLWFDGPIAAPTSVGLTLQVSELRVEVQSIVKKSIEREIFLGGKPMAALQEVF